MPRLRLPWDSHFSAATLRRHLESFPHLAFWSPASGEYVIGGCWRGRQDIGLVVEASKGPTSALLIDRLVSRFREGAFRAAVLSPDEMDRAAGWYLDHGWCLLDRLLAFRLRLSPLKAEAESPLLFSPFQPQDLEALTELDRAAFPWLWWNEPSDFLAYSSSPPVTVFLARGNGVLLGYISYSTLNSRGHLDRLAVHPSFRGKDCGSQLLAFALRRMWESGVREVSLTTQEKNRAAQELYRRFGFRHTGEVHRVLGLEL